MTLTRRSFGALAAGALTATAVRAQSTLTIVAVNYPLAYFAQRIAGEGADVTFPVPDDVDPSFWRPTIADISTIQGADVIALNGAGFADWVGRTTLPRSRIADTSAAFADRYIATETVTHSHGEGGEHSHTGTASYTWLDFALAAEQARALATAILRRAPGQDAAVTEALDALTADLAALDTRAREVGGLAEGVPIIASHPRYQYFARAYGLDMRAVEWDAVAPPTEEQWTALEALAADTGARLFVWEADPGAEAAARMADLGLASVVFPPLAGRPAEGDFVSAMTAALDRLEAALQEVLAG